MDEQTFETTDPLEIAERLNLEVVQWLDGILFVREKDNPYSDLFSIGPVDAESGETNPAGLRLRVYGHPMSSTQYVGEIYHTPSEAASHAGLTVIEKIFDRVDALDGFGRKFSISPSGNGPTGSFSGWGTEEELSKWAPKHWPAKRQQT